MLPSRFLIDCPPYDGPSLWLTAARERIFAAAKAAVSPALYHTLGGAGAGKTTWLGALRRQGFFPDGAVFIAFDDIMENLPGYTVADIRSYEQTARAIGYDLLSEALDRRYPVVLEHSGARDDHVLLLRHTKEELGYRIILLDVVCDPQLRARPVPRNYVFARAAKIATLRPHYRALADEYITKDVS